MKTPKYDKVIFVEAFRNPYILRRGQIFSELGYACELWRWYKNDQFKKTLKEAGPFEKFGYFNTENELRDMVQQVREEEKVLFYTGVTGLYVGGVHAHFINYCWERSNLSQWPKEALFTLTNKHLTNCLLRDLGVTDNHFCKVDAFDYTESEIDQVKNYPVIVKPIEGRGSMFVYKCNNKNEVLRSLKDYSQGSEKREMDYSGAKVRVDIGNNKIEYDSYGEVLIEDCALGIEFSLDVYCDGEDCEILMLLDKRVMVEGKASFYQEFMVAQNDRIPEEIIDRAKSWIKKITISMNKMSLFGHVEFIWNPESNQLKLLEFNPREAGLLVAQMITLKTGLNVDELSVRKALGEKLKMKELIQRNEINLALAVFQPKTNGILIDVKGVEDLEDKFKANIFGIMKHYTIGQKIFADHEECFLITLGLKAKSNDELEHIYDQAKRMIQFDIDPFDQN